MATIDLTAGRGRSGFAVGDRVTISGTGLYSGESAVIERLAGGPIPSAVVRTEAGYVVIEKTGEKGTLVEQRYPRR